jgi:acyl carrier protein
MNHRARARRGGSNIDSTAPIHAEVVAMINEVCRPDPPTLADADAPLVESGLDSLDFATLLLMLEDKYHVSIGEDNLERVDTLNKIVNYIGERIGRKG